MSCNLAGSVGCKPSGSVAGDEISTVGVLADEAICEPAMIDGSITLASLSCNLTGSVVPSY